MIASTNPKPTKGDFENLLAQTLRKLNYLASSNKLDGSVLAGRDLEPFIEEQMNQAAKGTSFHGTIVRYGGQMFPDIVANKYYGVEVKSTTQNHWTTTGNSVLESTRVGNVERIYMMFGKLASPIEFRYRPYEACLSEVVVTHSPRYLINMELQAGETIFDKMKMPYDRLRLHNPPIEPILNYYRTKLKPGEQIWWLGNTSSLVMRFWSSLTSKEREDLKINGFVFFPEVFSNRSDKFNDLASWLVQKKNVVCPNLRDMYSAGGKVTVRVNRITYKGIPRIIENALRSLPAIVELISNTSIISLSTAWNVSITRKGALATWIRIVDREASRGGSAINIARLLNDYIKARGL